MMIYRGAELDRWEAKHGGPFEEPTATARALDTRTAARDALYRVELSTASNDISQAVRTAFNIAKSIKDSETIAEAKRRRNEVERKLEEVTHLARQALGVWDV